MSRVRVAIPIPPAFSPMRLRVVHAPEPIEVQTPGLIRTARLVLRPLRRSDRPEFLRVLATSRGHLEPHAPLHRHGESDEAMFERQVAWCHEGDRRGTAWRRAAFLDNGRLAGCFHLCRITRGLEFSAEAVWWVSADVTGRGLGTEGVQAMLDYALAPSPRGLGLMRVTALVASENLASRRVAEHADMTWSDASPVLIARGERVIAHETFVRESRG